MMVVLETFRALVAERPDAPLFTWVDDDGRDEATLTRARFAEEADAVAAYLLTRSGLRPGDRALLVYPPSLDFIRAFIGCLIAGIVPVPVYPPNPLTLGKDLATFAAIAADCGAAAVLSTRAYGRATWVGKLRGLVTRGGARWPDLPWHATDGLGAAPPQASPAQADDVAFLQYTSGSTSMPKGVVITHGNLLHQLAMNADWLGLRPEARAVLWVPQYHDLGLISGIASAIVGNGQLYLMSPATFIRQPGRWLEVCARVNATHTAAPNFALDLVVRKTTPAERAAWDLSSLEVVLCAAEPIRPATVAGFLAAFAPSGLRPETFCAAYGLAEHTVGISSWGRPLDLEVAALQAGRAVPATGEGARPIFGAGAAGADVVVRIVDPETCEALPDGAVGEIWADSPSKAAGYWGRPEESREAFEATIAGDPDGRTYLRTGDLGFLLGGQVVVTGRRKDMLILRGRNHYPQDLEEAVREAHPLVRPGGIAAFAVDEGGEERLAVAVEVTTDRPAPAVVEAVAQAVHAALLREHQVPCRHVVVGRKGLVPKTTSGKVRRQACRQAFEADALGGKYGAFAFDAGADGIPTPDAAPVPALEDGLGALAAAWEARPASFDGPQGHYELAWVARAADEAGAPRFPAALARLRKLVGPATTSPTSDLIVAVAHATTLLRWDVAGEELEAAFGAIFAAIERLGDPPRLAPARPHGRHHHLDGLFGDRHLPRQELQRLLASAGDRLAPARRERLMALVEALDVGAERAAWLTRDPVQALADDALVVNFGEFFPDAAFRTPEAAAHAARWGGLPAGNLAVAARYAEATHDPATIAAVERALVRADVPSPHGRLLELAFALYYLTRGGVDVARWFPRELAELAANVGPAGLPVYPATPADADMTSLAILIARQAGGLQVPSAAALEHFWRPGPACYEWFDGNMLPNVSTEVHVLEAVLGAPDVPPAHKRAVWQRTVRLLEERPWHEKFHASPFYIWEAIVDTGFRHAAAFPDLPTRVHHEALELILAHEAPGGGFRSAAFPAPVRQETALALLALATAEAHLPAGALRDKVAAALARGRAVLAEQRRLDVPRPPLWVAKTLLTAPHIDEALELAALHAGTAAEDPRLVGLDDAFREVMAGLGRQFARMGQARGGRTFHLAATTLRGELVVAPDPALPAHAFFAPGRRFPVLVRHANGVQDDDAAPDNRGATLRVLDPAAPDDPGRPLLDLLLTTGECFTAATAADFVRWMTCGPEAREAWVARAPHLGEAAWGMFRTADSFTTLHYYSKTASRFVAADGSRHLARYRLVNPGQAVELGRLDPAGRPLPPEGFPRAPGDERAPDFLHADLRDRLVAGGIRYELQVQLAPADDEAALDATRPWPTDQRPWRTVARLTLDGRWPAERIEGLAFNGANAPADLGLVLASRPDQFASLEHLRSVVYEIAAAARTGRPLPQALRGLVSDEPVRGPQRIAVLGAGATGLTIARDLEALGYEVTVLERSPRLAGKCASIPIGDRWYDLGGHFCSANYHALAALVAEVGVATEPATPGVIFDLPTRRVAPTGDREALGPNFLRYVEARAGQAAGIQRPGLGEVGAKLAEPAASWLKGAGLEGLATAIGPTYTASGYGYVGDPELAALYFLKGVETFAGGGTGSDLPAAWTIQGGFARLWERVAEGLRDLRLGVEVTKIERDEAGVRLQTATGEALAFDRLVLACPLPPLLAVLDEHPEERELLQRVRKYDYYTTFASARGLPEQGFFLVRPHVDDPAHAGHVVAFHHRYPGSDVYAFYAYGGPELDGAAIQALLREDVERMGGQLGEVHHQTRWDYFPHFAPADVAAGCHERLEALQGRRGTYYAGSLLNFELVECNVAYARELVRRHFGVRGSVAQAPEPQAVAKRVFAGRDRVAALTAYLQGTFAQELGLATPPPADLAFADLGLDSIRSVQVFQRLGAETGVALGPTAFFDHPTLAELAGHMAATLLVHELAEGNFVRPEEAIALHVATLTDDDVDALLATLLREAAPA
jgi:acyl-CoA synthetase (AMP-forming)/AMP-acid ligase II